MKKTIISGLLLTLAAHSFCCILPLICFLLGFSSASSYFEFIHPYENYIFGLNIFLIIAGYYVHYIHKIKSKCDHQHCHSNSGKVTYWIITFISIIIMVWNIV